MATLTNEQINLTYPGLIKTVDNLAIDGTPRSLTDGIGATFPMEISTTQINFIGGVDFSTAIVTGLSAGGLVAGPSLNGAMKSADFLTATPATANGANSIAIGNNASANAGSAIAIGNNTSVANSDSIAIGTNCAALNGPAIAIGRFVSANGSVATAIGNSASVQADQSIGISGENCTVSAAATRSIVIGRQAQALASNSLAIGNFAKINSQAVGSMTFTSCLVNINSQNAPSSLMMIPGQYGCVTNVNAQFSIVIGAAGGQIERATTLGVRGIAIGFNTITNAEDAVALGSNVTAARADTVSVREIEMQTVGGGIIFTSPNGTKWKQTISDSGVPVYSLA
jgi:hypothetical protein